MTRSRSRAEIIVALTIEASAQEDRIVTLTMEELGDEYGAVLRELACASDDSAEDTELEYWGMQRGSTWRVHVEVMTDAQRGARTEVFARCLAVADARACRLARLPADDAWTGEHTSALAEHLGCSVGDLPPDLIESAERAYRAAVRAGVVP